MKDNISTDTENAEDDNRSRLFSLLIMLEAQRNIGTALKEKIGDISRRLLVKEITSLDALQQLNTLAEVKKRHFSRVHVLTKEGTQLLDALNNIVKSSDRNVSKLAETSELAAEFRVLAQKQASSKRGTLLSALQPKKQDEVKSISMDSEAGSSESDDTSHDEANSAHRHEPIKHKTSR